MEVWTVLIWFRTGCVCVCVCVCVCMWEHACVCTYVHTYVCMYVCMYVCVRHCFAKLWRNLISFLTHHCISVHTHTQCNKDSKVTSVKLSYTLLLKAEGHLTLNESFTLDVGCLPIISNVRSIRKKNTTASTTAQMLRSCR